MAPVLRLVQRTFKDTVEVLKALLSLALDGKLKGVAICYMDTEGHEDFALTGIYKANAAYTVSAAEKLKTELSLKRDGTLH